MSFRSRPVFNVTAHLSFTPKEISTNDLHCQGNTDKNHPLIDVTACFEMEEITKSKKGMVLIR